MNGFSALASAVLIGGTLAAGLLCVLAALPRWRAASLTVRIAPYVRDVVADEDMPRGLLPATGMLPASGRSPWQRAQHAFERMLGGGEALRQVSLRQGCARIRSPSEAASWAGCSPGSVSEHSL